MVQVKFKNITGTYTENFKNYGLAKRFCAFHLNNTGYELYRIALLQR